MGRKKKIQDLELAYLVGAGLNQREIAEKLEVSRSSVTLAIKRMKEEQPELLEEKSIEDFRKGEADDLATMRRLIVAALKKKLRTTSLKNISLQQLGMLYGIMFDKDRLLNDQSTENHAVRTYSQLDGETRAVIGDAVRRLTDGMLNEARTKAKEEYGILDNGQADGVDLPKMWEE